MPIAHRPVAKGPSRARVGRNRPGGSSRVLGGRRNLQERHPASRLALGNLSVQRSDSLNKSERAAHMLFVSFLFCHTPRPISSRLHLSENAEDIPSLVVLHHLFAHP